MGKAIRTGMQQIALDKKINNKKACFTMTIWLKGLLLQIVGLEEKDARCLEKIA